MVICSTMHEARERHGFVVVKGLSGHRLEYQLLFARSFSLEPVSGPLGMSKFRALVTAERVLFATIDDDLVGYFLVSATRALLGRRTVGIYLRPQSCNLCGLKAWFKRQAFSVLKRLPPVSTLSIIPFDLDPSQANVVRGWLHDPQLWDLYGVEDNPDTAMRATIRQKAGRREVLAFLGQVSVIKGFPLLAAALQSDRTLLDRFCVVVAGQVSEDCVETAKTLEEQGVIFISRRLSDPEMTAVYQEAALIWACYDPSYDQASGIFGRATQRGRMVIVREHSLLVRYAEMLNFPALQLPCDPIQAADVLASATIIADPTVEVRNDWQKLSIRAIERVL